MNQEWREQAACRGMDISRFFIPKATPGQHQMYREARSICGACPVQEQCLEYVMEVEKEEWKFRSGFWAGLTAQQRYNLQVQRDRSRRVA